MRSWVPLLLIVLWAGLSVAACEDDPRDVDGLTSGDGTGDAGTGSAGDGD